MSKNISVENSLFLSTRDFEIIGEVEYDQFGGGMCCEGHPIKYGIELQDTDGDIYVFGNTCIYKPFVFKHWNPVVGDLENPDLMKAGRNLWIIARDNLKDYITEIPHPRDLNWDYAKLNEKLKAIVANAKKSKKTYLKKIAMETQTKARKERFRKANEVQHGLIKQLITKLKFVKEKNMLGLLSEWEREFIVSIIGQHRDMRILSERQKAIMERIINTEITVEKHSAENKEIAEKLTNAVKHLKDLNPKEREYILSFQNQFFRKGSLSERQLEVLDSIIHSESNKYIGIKMRSWITEQKSGFEGERGVITSVEAETGKAILCNFTVRDMEFKSWVPKSQLHMEEK